MKKMIFLSFVVLFLASSGLAQEKVEVPIWQVGDKWTYKDVTVTTWTSEVSDIKEDLFILKIGDPAHVGSGYSGVGYDKKTMNEKYLI